MKWSIFLFVFPTDKILITPPTYYYGMYAVCVQVNAVPLVKVPLIPGGDAFQLDIPASLPAIPQSNSFSCAPPVIPLVH